MGKLHNFELPRPSTRRLFNLADRSMPENKANEQQLLLARLCKCKHLKATFDLAHNYHHCQQIVKKSFRKEIMLLDSMKRL